MKTIILTMLAIVIMLSTYGQSYYPLIRPNTFWDVQNGDGSQVCGLNGGGRYFFQGDTTILGIQYQKMYRYPIVTVNPGPYCPPFAINNGVVWLSCFMREDTIAKKVYVNYGNNEPDFLLFDFTLLVGDTLIIPYTQVPAGVVDSVSTITLINGYVRKIIYLHNHEHYIESIGGSQGVCFPLTQAVGGWHIPGCVIENNVNLWGMSCYGYVGIESVEYKTLVNVLPNPSQEYLKVIQSDNLKSTFTVYDLTTRIVITQKLFNKTEIVDITNLKSGTYIYILETAGTRKGIGKFIVTK